MISPDIMQSLVANKTNQRLSLKFHLKIILKLALWFSVVPIFNFDVQTQK